MIVDYVSRALSFDDLPKAWGAALRELRGLLLDNVDFQKQLIKAADGDAMMFAAVLQGALFLSPGERQSLMVKLARISPELRDYLENGAGQRILKAGIGVTDTGAPVEQEPNYTSVKSHKRLMAELDDIINVQVPENREALKVARAHGDFRENSEFDAAKERRNFLSRRRTELERDLSRVQGVNFRNVTVEDIAVIGQDNEPFSGLLIPALATIDENLAIQSKYLIEFLLALIEKKELPPEQRCRRVVPSLVWRESAGVPAGTKVRDEDNQIEIIAESY